MIPRGYKKKVLSQVDMLSNETRDKIVLKFKGGERLVNIAREYSISLSAVSQIVTGAMGKESSEQTA